MLNVKRNQYVLAAVFFSLLLSGCGKEESPPIHVKATNAEHDVVLLSELPSLSESEQMFAGDFLLTNISPKKITLELDMTSCGCLSLRKDNQPLTERDRFTIAPNAQAVVSMETQIPVHPGLNRYEALFTYNDDSKERSLILAIQCPVLNDCFVFPSAVKINFDREAIVPKEFSIMLTQHSRDKSDLDKPPFLRDVLPSHVVKKKEIVFSPARETEKGVWQKIWRFDFAVMCPSDALAFSSPLRIGFASSVLPVAEFTLLVHKTFGVDAPRQLTFPETAVTKDYTRTISLQSADSVPFEIVSTSCDNDSFITLGKHGIAKQHWIEISFVPRFVGGQKGRLILETTHPESKTIHIDLIGTAFSKD